jgi:hypothetical protein
VSGASVTGNNYTATSTGSAPVTNASISGTIAGAITGGVTVKLYSTVSATPQTTITDASGFYMFSGLSNGTYTIIPGLTAYSFSPATANVAITGPSITGTNFSSISGSTVATNNTISGMISGAVLQGITVILHTPSGQQATVTDATGYYQFTGLSNGTYTAIPTLTGYSFTPANLVVTLNNSSNATTSFVTVPGASNSTYPLSGIITGDVLEGVTVNLYGSTVTTTTTDVNGYYQFTNLADGSYTAVPSKNGLAFTPSNRAINVAGAAATGNDFKSGLTQHNLSGWVGSLPGVTMIVSGGASTTVTTDAAGNFFVNGLNDGTYVLMPSLGGYSFNPLKSSVTLKGANIASIAFVPTQLTNSISGNIQGANNIVVTLSDGVSPPINTTTDVTGNYSFADLLPGTYTITPSLSQYLFSPASTTVTMSGTNIVGTNFTAAIHGNTVHGATPTYSCSNGVVTVPAGAYTVTFTAHGGNGGSGINGGGGGAAGAWDSTSGAWIFVLGGGGGGGQGIPTSPVSVGGTGATFTSYAVGGQSDTGGGAGGIGTLNGKGGYGAVGTGACCGGGSNSPGGIGGLANNSGGSSGGGGGMPIVGGVSIPAGGVGVQGFWNGAGSGAGLGGGGAGWGGGGGGGVWGGGGGAGSTYFSPDLVVGTTSASLSLTSGHTIYLYGGSPGNSGACGVISMSW